MVRDLRWGAHAARMRRITRCVQNIGENTLLVNLRRILEETSKTDIRLFQDRVQLPALLFIIMLCDCNEGAVHVYIVRQDIVV
jgi:hypothetical protein